MVLSLGNLQFYLSVLQTLQIDAKIGLYVMCNAFPSQLPKFNGISPYKCHLFNENTFKYIEMITDFVLSVLSPLMAQHH